jgi:hypothetical protein
VEGVLSGRDNHFQFGSVFFFKKITKPILKKTETELKPVQTDRFRFVFLGQKPVQTGLALFFRFGSVFLFGFGSVFSISEPNRSVFSKF